MGLGELLMLAGAGTLALMLVWVSAVARSQAVSGRLALGPGAADGRARLEEFAKAHGGALVLERSTVGGHVLWEHAGLSLFFYEKTQGADAWTVLSAGADEHRLPTWQVRPRQGPVPALPRLSDRPPSGEPSEFDDRFVIRTLKQGPPPARPSPRVVALLLELGDHCAPAGPTLEVHEHRVRLYLPRLLGSGRERLWFGKLGPLVIQTVLADLGAMAAAEASHMIQGMVLESGNHEVCPVCAEALGPARVVCNRCRTPHHGDCWEYSGQCALYGCQSTEGTRSGEVGTATS